MYFFRLQACRGLSWFSTKKLYVSEYTLNNCSREIGESVRCGNIRTLQSPTCGDLCLVYTVLGSSSLGGGSYGHREAGVWSKGKVLHPDPNKRHNHFVYSYDTGKTESHNETKIYELNSEKGGADAAGMVVSAF